MVSYRTLFQNRRLRRFSWVGSLSYGAPAATVLILVWTIANAPEYAGHLSYSALSLALNGLAATVPTLGAALVSGTLADRIERRRLMRLTNGLAIVGLLGILGSLYFRPDAHIPLPGPAGYFLPMWMLLLFPSWAAVTAATTLFRPAYNATLPNLVPKSDLGSANGLIFALSIAVLIVASLGTTGLLELASSDQALAVLFPLALLVGAQGYLRTIDPSPVPRRSGPAPSFLHDARKGYAYLWQRRELLEITVTALAINFLSTAAFVELGLYTTRSLGVSDAILYGAMVTGSSIGVAIGSLLMGRIHFERYAGRALALVTAGEGVSVLILGLSRTIWISLPDMVLFGVFPGMYMTVFLATIQATVPSELLGRVLAADEVGSYAMVPVGQYIGGILTIVLGSAQTPFLIAGFGTLLVAAIMFAFRRLRHLSFDPTHGEPSLPPEPPPAAPGVPGESFP